MSKATLSKTTTVTNSMSSMGTSITSNNITSPNPNNRINPDLMQVPISNIVNCGSDIAKTSADPNATIQKDTEGSDDTTFDAENDDPDEDFSHVSSEEQAVLKHISRIIRGSLPKC